VAPGKKTVTLESLSPEAVAAMRDRKLAGQDSFKRWQKLLAELAAFDAQTDALMQAAKKRMITYFVLAIIMFFLMFFAIPVAGALGDAAGGVYLAAALIAAIVALFVFFIVQIFRYMQKGKRLKNVDLLNDFRLCLIPFLDELAEDCDPKTKMKLNLDLSGLTPQKVFNTRQVPPGRFRAVTETFSWDPWCHLSMKLIDGSVMILDLKNYVMAQKREWSNPRGKHKSKTKWRKIAIVSATLIPDVSDTEWDEAKLTERARQDKLKVTEKKGAKVARLVRKWKFKSVNQEPDVAVAPNEVMGMLMQLYGMLKAAP